VVLIDELVNRGCLAHARSGRQGDRGRQARRLQSTPQAFIEKLMICTAKQRPIVCAPERRRSVRLRPRRRGARRCSRRGIEVEVIPGITAGSASRRARHSGHASRARARRHFVTGTRGRREPIGARWRARHDAGHLHGPAQSAKIVSLLQARHGSADARVRRSRTAR
jgi:siroheme synthase